jgi:hypothetical protein
VTERVKVPADVLEGIEVVRELGQTNMFDIWRVGSLAQQLGYPETAAWLLEEENQKAYVRGMLSGFEAQEAS